MSIAHLVASDLIERGFVEALRTGSATVDDWYEKVDTYGRDYMTSGAGEIQKRLAADLVVLQQQLDQPQLWALPRMIPSLPSTNCAATGEVKTTSSAKWLKNFSRS